MFGPPRAAAERGAPSKWRKSSRWVNLANTDSRIGWLSDYQCRRLVQNQATFSGLGHPHPAWGKGILGRSARSIPRSAPKPPP